MTDLKTSEKTDKISVAMHLAQGQVCAVAKDGNNKYDKYKYATLENFINVVQPVMKYNGLSLICSTVGFGELTARTTKAGGSEYAYHITVTGRLIHTSGQWIEMYSIGHGQDRADKGIYKAITGARKYLLSQLFNLATSDDSEATELNLDGDDQKKKQNASDPVPEPENHQLEDLWLRLVELTRQLTNKYKGKPDDVIRKQITARAITEKKNINEMYLANQVGLAEEALERIAIQGGGEL